MELSTRQPAEPDVLAPGDGSPELRPATGEVGGRLAGIPIWVQVLGALVVAGGISVALAHGSGVVGVGALRAVLRTAAVTLVLFAACGFPAATWLARNELRPYLLLMVLPLGAAISALALAVLGLLHVPLDVSLAVVLGAGALACAWTLARRGRDRTSAARGPAVTTIRWPLRIALPLILAALVALISLIPSFRSGFATVPGQNGDAILVVGVASLLEHAPPTATRTDTPIPRIPVEWRSKYPIYYPLAAASRLAGQDPITAFPTVAGIMLALAALGFFLFAALALRAPPFAALLAMFLLPLDRIVMYVLIHPYYNETWGQFALPFTLLTGWLYLQAPSRRAFALFALFALLGLLAYPLMYPFPVLFLGTAAWRIARRRRAEGEPVRWLSALGSPRALRRPWVWVPALVVAIPVVTVLGRGVFEKIFTALQVLAPGTNLFNWGGAGLGYLPWPQFAGLPGNGLADAIGLAVVCLLAGVGLRYVREDIRLPLAVTGIGGALIGCYFRVRTYGDLFFFKDLAFLGPYVLMLALVAVVGAARSASRLVSAAGLTGVAAALVVVPNAAAAEINLTGIQATPSVLELATWNRELPAGASVRIDVPPSGWQLWAGYMLTRHRLSTLTPIGGIFPHPALGRKADYVLGFVGLPRPVDAIGAPILRNQNYVVWRMNPAVPGPDLSRRPLVYDYSTINFQ